LSLFFSGIWSRLDSLAVFGEDAGLMPKLILICLVLVTLFFLLCGPALVVARRLERRGDVAALRALPGVWVAQFITAAVLIFAADALGLHNPAGYIVASVLGTGVAGAALFGGWRLAKRWLRLRR
jgi:uncharacterized membrane protein